MAHQSDIEAYKALSFKEKFTGVASGLITWALKAVITTMAVVLTLRMMGVNI